MNKILSETRIAIEHIISADGSADETASVLRQLHDGLLILTEQANQIVYGRKCYQRCESGYSATWVEIFMPEDSLPVASIARTRPDHTSDISASSGDLHTPQQDHYSSDC